MADQKRYGDPAPAPLSTASTTGALDGLGALSGLLPYYLVAVAAGVTVWWITRILNGKKKGKG